MPTIYNNQTVYLYIHLLLPFTCTSIHCPIFLCISLIFFYEIIYDTRSMNFFLYFFFPLVCLKLGVYLWFTFFCLSISPTHFIVSNINPMIEIKIKIMNKQNRKIFVPLGIIKKTHWCQFNKPHFAIRKEVGGPSNL